MYEKVFHFNSRPFTATPFVKHYFSGDSIDPALGQAKTCIDRASGPVIAIGAAGTGKSLLLAMLEEQYQAHFNVVNLACGKLEKRQDLLQSILFELQQPYQGLTDSELRFALIEFLSPSEQCAHGVLLLIDEAHLLSTEMLDEVRLITNFIRDGQPRVRLVMAGNHRLEENLTDPKLESFNQRIAARCYLSNMSQQETGQYVVEHIDRAGGEGQQLFNDASLKAIYEVSDGCPRLVNQVCDHALILAATRGELVVTDQCIHEAWSDVQSIPGNWAAPATQPESADRLEDDDNWTVIEFGQLDDSDSGSEEGTVYEFSNQPLDDAAASKPEPDVAAPVAQSDENDSYTLAPETDPIQAETDCDESESLAWNPAEEDNPWPSQDIDTSIPVASENHVDGDVPDELELIESLSLHDQNDQEIDLLDRSSIASDEQAEASGQDATRDIREMEAQLKAIFGDEMEADSVSESNKDIAELEAEQIAILDQVEAGQSGQIETSNLDAPLLETSTGKTEAPASFGIADADLADSEENVDAPASIPMQVEVHVQGEVESSDIGADAIESDAPEESGTAPAAGPTHAEIIDGVPANRDAKNLEGSNAPPRDVATEAPVVSSPADEMDDPFAEQFAEEEQLMDRYAPFVAHQNQTSLNITPKELELIQPLDVDETQAGVNSPFGGESQQCVTEQVTDSDQAAPRNATVLLDADGPVNLTTDDPSPSGSSNPGGGESDSGNSEYESQPEAAYPAQAATDVEKEPAAEMDAPVSEQPTQRPVAPTVVNLARPVSPTAWMPSESETSGREPAATIHNDGPATADIERQAEAILERLRAAQDVSCETDGADGIDANTSDGPKAQSQSLSPQSVPRRVEPTIALDTGPLALNREGAESQPGETSEFDRQSAALDETQQILNEILASKNLLASQQGQTYSDPQASFGDDLRGSQALTNDSPQSNGERDANDGPADDREMIIINKMDEQRDPDATTADPIEFPETPISKGRAERMDYQKLFDQLRDISNSQQ